MVEYKDLGQVGNDGAAAEQMGFAWKSIYFADLRGDSEYEDGTIPEPQIYSDLQQIWIQRRQNVVEFPTNLGRIHCGS